MNSETNAVSVVSTGIRTPGSASQEVFMSLGGQNYENIPVGDGSYLYSDMELREANV